MKPIQITELGKDTLKKLGLIDEVDIGSHVKALSKVLDALKSEQKADAVWALTKALQMIDAPLEESQPQGGYPQVILTKVAEIYGFRVDDLIAKGRSPELVTARWVAMYVLWRAEGFTLDVIGKVLGGRSPATITWGVQQLQKSLTKDAELAAIVNKLLKVKQ